jgi:hypothetical protein
MPTEENRTGMVRYNLPNVVQLSFQKEVRFAWFSLQKVAACTMGIILDLTSKNVNRDGLGIEGCYPGCTKQASKRNMGQHLLKGAWR